jgi:hypothetical protein
LAGIFEIFWALSVTFMRHFLLDCFIFEQHCSSKPREALSQLLTWAFLQAFWDITGIFAHIYMARFVVFLLFESHFSRKLRQGLSLFLSWAFLQAFLRTFWGYYGHFILHFL